MRNKESRLLLDSEPVITAADLTDGRTAPEWSRWQGPGGDNKSPDTGLLKKWPVDGPKLLWTAENLGDGFSSVSVADRKIYITGMKSKRGELNCLDWKGNPVWRMDYGPEWAEATPGVRCTPVVYDGSVYLITGRGRVVCVSTQTGQENWNVDPFTEFEGQMPRWGVAMSPVIADGKVIFVVGGKKAAVVALDARRGYVVWSSKSNGDSSAYCTPTVIRRNGRTIVVGMTLNHLFAADVETGDLFWQYPIEDYLAGKNREIHPNTPVYHDGAVMFTSGYNMGAVRFTLTPDAWTFRKDWTNPDFDCHHGGVVCQDGYVYGANWLSNGDGLWMCVDWKTGETMVTQRWRNKGALVWADGLFYAYAERPGGVALIDANPREFKIVSEFDITLGDGEHWAHPVISGKRLFIRHGNVLMVYDIAA